MKITRKIVGLFLLVCPVLIGLNVQAEESSVDTITVTLHKRLFDKKPETSYQNTGEEMAFDGKPLPDVEFQVVEVTERYAELLNQQKNPTKVIQQLQLELAESPPTKGLVKKRTDQRGMVTFHQLNKKVNGQNAVYAFIETGIPEGMRKTEMAAPILLVTPVYKVDTQGQATSTELTDVHIYPKNMEQTPIVPKIPEEPYLPEEPRKAEPQPKKGKVVYQGQSEKHFEKKQVNKTLLPSTGYSKSLLNFLGICMIVGVGVFYKKGRRVQS